MENTIQELEREIEQFHQNVKDSNELMEILMSTTSLLKDQTVSFEKQTDLLQNELSSLPTEIPQKCEQSLEKTSEIFSKQLQTTTEEFQGIPEQLIKDIEQQNSTFSEDIKNTIKSYIERLDQTENHINILCQQCEQDIKKTNEAFSEDVKNTINAYLIQLDKTEKGLNAMSTQFETKYEEFLSKIEETKIDQVYGYCQDMNKSLNVKIGITLGGVAIAIIISIISLMI